MIINPYSVVPSGPPLAGPLDGYGADLWAAWAPYRLLGSFSGAYIRVRRASDDAEADCGSDAEIAAHCGGSSGFVRTLYDQSGNGRHAHQTSQSSQPQIYDGSSVIAQVGGKPSCQFDGLNDFLVCPVMSGSGLTTVDYFGAARVQQDPAESVNGGPPFWVGTATDPNTNDHHTWVDGNIYTGTFRTERVSGDPTDSLTLTHVLNNTSVTGGNFTVRLNSQTLHNSSAGSFSLTTYNSQSPEIGRSAGLYGPFPMWGWVGAVLLYSSDRSADRAAIRSAIS